MVFIDAENVSSTHAASIENEIWDIGNVAEVRYYAMQKDPATANWKSTIKEYGYKPILMAGEREKNKIDNKIIRDAKKVLNENKSIDIFVIVSRDGDYTELVRFLTINCKNSPSSVGGEMNCKKRKRTFVLLTQVCYNIFSR